VLYELKRGVRLGWEIEDLNEELTALFGRPVDLVSKKALHPLLRKTVLTESRPLYAA
jgi:predicted nucleotidyltransferase